MLSSNVEPGRKANLIKTYVSSDFLETTLAKKVKASLPKQNLPYYIVKGGFDRLWYVCQFNPNKCWNFMFGCKNLLWVVGRWGLFH